MGGHDRRVSAALAYEGIFKIVKTNLQHRALQMVDSGRRSCCVAVVRVGLSDRQGEQAVLTSSPSDTIHNFDSLEFVQQCGVKCVFNYLTTWPSSKTTKLAKGQPARPTHDFEKKHIINKQVK